MPKLTEKQKRFCEEYLVDLNATQACIRSGYSENTANRIGSENLSKPVIHSYIQELRSKQQERTQITADRVLQEISKIAFSKITNLVNWKTGEISLEDYNSLTEDDKCAIESVSEVKTTVAEQTEKITLRVKLYDKMKALESLGKHLGIYEKDNNQKDVKIKVSLK